MDSLSTMRGVHRRMSARKIEDPDRGVKASSVTSA